MHAKDGNAPRAAARLVTAGEHGGAVTRNGTSRASRDGSGSTCVQRLDYLLGDGVLR